MSDEHLMAEELAQLSQAVLIELFEIDLTTVSTTLPIGTEPVVRFHAGVNEFNRPVVFQGNTYNPYPIRVTGFEFSTEGAPPRPSLAISNIGGWVSSLLSSTDDLVGAAVTRRRTFAKYLDHMPSAAARELPPDKFRVIRKVTESRTVVELELGSALDMDGVFFPRRQVVADYCSWSYRGRGCGFAEDRYVGHELGPTGYVYSRYRGAFDPATSYSRVNGKSDCVLARVGAYPCIYACLVDAPASITGLEYHPANAPDDWRQVQRLRGQYDSTVTDYVLDDVVWVEVTIHSGQQRVYAIVGRVDAATLPAGTNPLSSPYWRVDSCGKRLSSCSARYDPVGAGLTLPYGGFPGTANLPRSST